MTLVEKILAIDEAFESAGIPHGFGGALALAWCTGQARSTIDIDVNVFLDYSRAAEGFQALPDGVTWDARQLAVAERDGQVRLWWDSTPVDIFMNTTEFHEQAAGRVRCETLAGRDVPFLACSDLAVFKVFFNRTKDWADIEEMITAGTLDAQRLVGVLVAYLGTDDERVGRLLDLLRVAGVFPDGTVSEQ